MKKSSEQSISLIITTYHKDQEMTELTRKCLASLDPEGIDEVIVVDDCSPYIEHFDNIKQIFRNTNGGFPVCANTGFKAATGDILILSNNDIEFTDGWLEAILKPLNEGFDISSIRTSDNDGEETEGMITEDDYFGSLWVMKREVYKTIGGFDERFKDGTFEDKDFYIRAKDAGFRIGKNHSVSVKHVGRATMNTLFPEQEDFHANAQRFKDKHGFII